MNATQVLEELPRLTEAERRAVRQKLLELAAEDEEVRACDQAATDGARLLDAMEEWPIQPAKNPEIPRLRSE